MTVQVPSAFSLHPDIVRLVQISMPALYTDSSMVTCFTFRQRSLPLQANSQCFTFSSHTS